MTEAATGLFKISFAESVMDAYTFLHDNQEWKTIKYGMQRFPNAFKPILDKYIKYDCKVFKLKIPFGVVRQWELPDKLDKNDDIDYIRRRAIRELNYDNSAKIFLKFKSRFWEKDSRPIVCDDQGNPDKDGPAILLGSYTWVKDAAKYSPYPQKENVKLCLENPKILHPEVDVGKEWLDGRGNSSIYWPNDPTTVGAFALF
ncbi:unnamed protein product [Rhizophagus irregularis]|uniref:Amine oxidase domain-containing protein n=1 Tax=Rhizophagus irregularis TaxID=588596 RepID=A0A2I1GBC2_9GLOM|nr:hypothetical protein RhiirA4_458043 [Rhizophagus irregularis]CAB4442791.1 unnamed protein product [Rhizophagus irregularis]